MKRPETKLWNKIDIKGDFDTYSIEQYDNGGFYITSICGYDSSMIGNGKGHKSLVSAIEHVYSLIKNEYVDRCLEPKQ